MEIWWWLHTESYNILENPSYCINWWPNGDRPSSFVDRDIVIADSAFEVIREQNGRKTPLKAGWFSLLVGGTQQSLGRNACYIRSFTFVDSFSGDLRCCDRLPSMMHFPGPNLVVICQPSRSSCLGSSRSPPIVSASSRGHFVNSDNIQIQGEMIVLDGIVLQGFSLDFTGFLHLLSDIPR
jgi:hypothetical protein